MAIKNILVSKKKRYEQRTIQAECFAKNGNGMKFENYITEIFKTDIPLKKKRQGSDFYVEFKVDDVTYYFEAAKLATIPGRGTYYDIGFWVVEGDVDLGQSQTRKFNAPRVLAGVLKAFRQFMKERKPDIFQFSSTETGKAARSRMSLYQKFADWIVKNYPYEEVDEEDEEWRFVKKGKKGLSESETTLLKLLKKYVEADKKQSASLEPSTYTGSDVKLKHRRGTQAPVTRAMRALRKEWEKQGRDWANLPAWINKNKEKV